MVLYNGKITGIKMLICVCAHKLYYKMYMHLRRRRPTPQAPFVSIRSISDDIYVDIDLKKNHLQKVITNDYTRVSVYSLCTKLSIQLLIYSYSIFLVYYKIILTKTMHLFGFNVCINIFTNT